MDIPDRVCQAEQTRGNPVPDEDSAEGRLVVLMQAARAVLLAVAALVTAVAGLITALKG